MTRRSLMLAGFALSLTPVANTQGLKPVALAAAKDEEITQSWSLLNAGETLFTMPKAAVIRSFVLNHIIHHRAHLCVYLRLNDIPVPGLYGPSGDE